MIALAFPEPKLIYFSSVSNSWALFQPAQVAAHWQKKKNVQRALKPSSYKTAIFRFCVVSRKPLGDGKYQSTITKAIPRENRLTNFKHFYSNLKMMYTRSQYFDSFREKSKIYTIKKTLGIP